MPPSQYLHARKVNIVTSDTNYCLFYGHNASAVRHTTTIVGRFVAGAVEECGGGGGCTVDVMDDRSYRPVPHPHNHNAAYQTVSVRDHVSVGATKSSHACARAGEHGMDVRHYLTSRYQIDRRRQQRRRPRHHHDFVDRDHHYRVPADGSVGVSTSPSRQRTDGVDGSNPVAYIQRPAATTGTTHVAHTIRTLESYRRRRVRYALTAHIDRSDDNDDVSSYGSTER